MKKYAVKMTFVIRETRTVGFLDSREEAENWIAASKIMLPDADIEFEVDEIV